MRNSFNTALDASFEAGKLEMMKSVLNLLRQKTHQKKSMR